MKQTNFSSTAAAALMAALFSFSAGAQTDASKQEAKFLDQLSLHHQQEVQMGLMALEKGERKEIRKLGEDLVQDETKDLVQMAKWRGENYSSVPKATSASDQKMDLSSLETVSGAQFDQAFLRQVSQHHESGIQMVQNAVPNLKKGEIKRFAEKVLKEEKDEQKEIAALMKDSSKMSGRSGSSSDSGASKSDSDSSKSEFNQ